MAKAETKEFIKAFTEKQRDFYNYVSMGMPTAQAAKKAGYKSPYTSAAANVDSCREAFTQAFIEKGYSIPDIVDDILKGKEANKVISANIVLTKSDDPSVKAQLAHAKTMDFIDVPDWNARHKFIDTAIKLQDFYPKLKVDATLNHNFTWTLIAQEANEPINT